MAAVRAGRHQGWLVVGTYTQKLPYVDGKGPGLCLFEVVTVTNDHNDDNNVQGNGGSSSTRSCKTEIRPTGGAPLALRNPVYMTANESCTALFVVEETWNDGPGCVNVVGIRDGSLQLWSRVTNRGLATCHVALAAELPGEPHGDSTLVAVSYQGATIDAYKIDMESASNNKGADADNDGSNRPSIRGAPATSMDNAAAALPAGCSVSVATAIAAAQKQASAGPQIQPSSSTASSPGIAAVSFPGPVADRQEYHHPHMAALDPSDSDALYVPDLGADVVLRLSVSRLLAVGSQDGGGMVGEGKAGAVDESENEAGAGGGGGDQGLTSGSAIVGMVQMPAGSGPRHMAFDPKRRVAYVANELSSTLSILSPSSSSSSAAGGLGTREGGGEVGAGGNEGAKTFERVVGAPVSTLPSEWSGESFCAAIRVHPSGRWVYVSNRGHDSIAQLQVKEGEGDGGGGDVTVSLVACHPCGGRTPRDFAFLPSGDQLVVGNQDSNTIAHFDVDGESGALSLAGSLECNSPACVCFLSC